VLKRLPGITLSGKPGRGGEIRMRGLGNGYTQILINGERAPRGFALDSLPPEQVERIEITRGPVAEFSAQAIAGTINIVLREGVAKRNLEVKPSLAFEAGRPQPGVSIQKSDKLNNLGYDVTANVFHRDLRSESETFTAASNPANGSIIRQQQQKEVSNTLTDGIFLSTRLNWQLEGGDSFSFQPFLSNYRQATTGQSSLDQSIGLKPAAYANADSRTDADSTYFRGIVNWKLKLASGARLELKLNAGASRQQSNSTRNEFDTSGAIANTLVTNNFTRDFSLSNGGKYSTKIAKTQLLSLGWDLEGSNRNENYTNLRNGQDILATFGNQVHANVQRVALFVQNEFDITPLWSAYGGLRGEMIRTTSEAATVNGVNTSSVISPLFHSVWRLNEESKDQVRLGLTRSYRAPSLSNLVSLPMISQAFPVTGPNTISSPDSVGNPNLKPELAWGLDLAYEHYLSEGGVVSVGVFQRNIQDLIRSVTTLQNVSWSNEPRFVSMPVNIGSAVSRGIELEAKFRLAEFVGSKLPLELRANYSRFWSSVDNIQGPNNRLDQQPKQTTNFGADYRLTSLPMTIGGSVNLTPGFIVQTSNEQTYLQGNKRVVDIYALWKIDKDAQLRIAANNLLHARYDTSNQQLTATSQETSNTVARTYTSVSARLELKF